ncbi:protein kinase domain-containing protein [Streptomyces diastatochromogenes]|uniref:protein kinase domain-containing protein n=1 Tax=Streptomyces diastatochromogenes TaxID=42236 RepID=UPI0036C4789F
MPPTRVVDPDDGGFARVVETRPVLADVPPELSDRFPLVAVLSSARRPAEPVVLRVRDLTARHGAAEIPLVLKWYHRRHAPERDVERELTELAEQPAPHLERLLETGEAHGHPWHLYWSHGEETLERYHADHPDGLAPDVVRSMVGQLYDAVTALHERGVVHRDITPDNIMVQTRRADTADLVLIDFGAAVHRPDEALDPRTDWRGKPLYLAPEAGLLRQTVSEAGDWWSLGMVIAQLALGRHPIDFRRDEDVLAEIATHDPDLGGVGDRRTRRLCEGLLTRAPEHRWHAEQVRDWLDGKDPDVAPRTDGRIFDDDTARPVIEPFPFMGQEFTGADQLAVHLDQNHVSAARMLAADDDRARLVTWLDQFKSIGDRSPEELRRLAELRTQLKRPPSVAGLVQLLNWLGPGLDVSWHGADLDVQSMRRLCQGARDGNADAVALIRHLADHPAVLTGLAQRPGGDGLDEADHAWRTLRARWEPTVREMLRSHETGRGRAVRTALRQSVAVDAWLLQLAREPERTRTRLTDTVLRRRARFPERVPWFDALLDAEDDDLRLLAAHLLSGHAETEAHGLRQRRVVEESERMLAADQDGLATVLRRLDRLPTLGWALLGATVVTAPWMFVTGLADVLGRASQEAVVMAWLEALPAAAFVFVVELWTAVYIGPPFYHPDRSLAGLLIRSAERPGRLARTRAGRFITAALLLLAVFVGFYAIAYAPWLWPLASAVAVAAWSVRRCLAWRRLRRGNRPRRTVDWRSLLNPRVWSARWRRRREERRGGGGGWRSAWGLRGRLAQWRTRRGGDRGSVLSLRGRLTWWRGRREEPVQGAAGQQSLWSLRGRLARWRTRRGGDRGSVLSLRGRLTWWRGRREEQVRGAADRRSLWSLRGRLAWWRRRRERRTGRAADPRSVRSLSGRLAWWRTFREYRTRRAARRQSVTMPEETGEQG